jgi:hypothetical protein
MLLRALIVLGVTAAGLFLGFLVGGFILTPLGLIPSGTGSLVGLAAGLVGGWLLARRTYPPYDVRRNR